MKAAVLKELNGAPEFDDFEDPVAGEGQVVVEMAAAATHHVDPARASGTFYLGPAGRTQSGQFLATGQITRRAASDPRFARLQA